MSQCEGGAAVTGDERRGEWKCPKCKQPHGYILRRNHITQLQLTVYPVRLLGGSYTCPNCGVEVTWDWRASYPSIARMIQTENG